ncbi:MAG: hypothetical protein AAGG99_09760 [Pseudomonadota bacterium]
MRRAIVLGVMTAAVLNVVPAASAHACACCAEPGQRVEQFTSFDDRDAFQSEVIRSLALGGAATLYRDAADWDEVIRGLNNPDRSTAYRVALTRAAKSWTFAFEDKRANSGRIAIRLPREFELFAADRTPGDSVGGSGPEFYKELRFSGVMTGSGMFITNGKGTARATVIFHGHGNGCTFAEQFTHWTLEAKGPGVQYRFYGRLRKTP